MKNRSSHKSIWIKLGVPLALLATAMLLVLPLHSTAQQENRQLNRDPVQQANGASARRIALVIGNGAYTNAPTLKNPPNDARDMAATLKALGFDVASGINVSQREMKSLIRDFGQKLKVGGSGLFYYAGHGVQSKGHNYLIPVDADIQSEAEVEDSGVDVSLVLNYMDDAQNGLNIVILDACRNNPFSRSFRSANNGLAQVDAPTGTLIAYATAPGRVASDGIGQNGMYTSELLKQMRVPGLSVTDMFMRVRAEVMKQTASKQVPWEASSLVGTFYFSTNATPATGNEPKKNEPTQPANIDAVAVEKEYWETIRSSNDPQDYKDYLQAYPNGAYAVVARAKIKQLETAKNTQPTNSQPANTQPSNRKGNTASEPASAANASASHPKTFRSQQGIEMVFIPPGKFTMGSNHEWEKPVHEVTISQAFYMGKYEVTQGQWQAVMDSNPSSFKGDDNLPVERVSWDDAQEFINKLNEINDGYTYRLPSEAEWEYACRAGTTEGYYSNNVYEIGWYKDNSGKKSHAVGSKQPNAFGLFDMSGNVWEWCLDWFVSNNDGAPADGSARLSGGEQKYRMFRGGSWSNDASNLHSAFRNRASPAIRVNDIGFRVVAVVRTEASDSQPTNTQPLNSGGNKPSEPAVTTNTSASQPASVKSKQGIEMVYIPPGKFMMGSNSQKPVHEVTISQEFYIGKYEVTQGQWQAVMGENSSHFKDCGSTCPAENVSWDDAQDFIKKLNEANDGFTYRLPSEAEWEYACRAGTTGDYYASDVDSIGWYADNSGQKTHAVGSKQPNTFGLYDMSGNVWEWCQDAAKSLFGQGRVLRGGSWGDGASSVSSAYRGTSSAPGNRRSFRGFRLVAVARTQ